jgi:xanthine dehydrogenase YagR molybdenum-binding subunit
MTTLTRGHAVGGTLARIEGPEKVTGRARYAVEYPMEEPVYIWLVQSSVVRGRIRSLALDEAAGVAGVVTILTHDNAPRLKEADDPELAVLQSDRVAYHGQIVAAVVADSLETAREAARLVRVDIEEEDHDSELRADHPRLYRPEKVNPSYEADTEEGDVEAALAGAAVVVDATYSTPAYHNNPMEPHATTAVWEGDRLTVYDSNQGVSPVRATLAKVFGLADENAVRVIAPHVGGGFGSKGTPRPIVIIAAMAAKAVGRPAKLSATRQQMFVFVGYRTPTVQHLRLGADANGRLVAVAHEVVEQTSTLREFAEQTAVASRMMYASPNRKTTHRLVRLDVPTPSWMRAPGEAPGLYALESAIDELAVAAGMDPIELRIRNEPERDPDTGLPFSSRNLIACLREGARRFGWDGRTAAMIRRREGRRLVGWGVASSTYPARGAPSSARVTRYPNGSFGVALAAADIGTGARTALTQIAADALGVAVEQVTVHLGDSSLPQASLAGGSMGINSWGWAVTKACRLLVEGRDEVHHGPGGEVSIEVNTKDDIAAAAEFARHAYGAQFVEVHVDPDTGEVRVSRMVGVFAAGRIVNQTTARSQFIGGMTMGLSMALLEESRMDHRFGSFVNHDLADYHIAGYADMPAIEVAWIDEHDPHLNPVGTKGIGEIGIVGTAAAVANAVYRATGIRVRDLPIVPAKLIR